ncbi:murein biosynthesis integral membrane protein MurJ [Catellatospora chokoriensis]|uniref:Membrane protein n=1 Tax=Catellatospora chokoriensis TaxID=310353 RepID=A0A8J3JZV3_9ACTN|nr:lipid II flippase MurJ [Catellatospora chokoriensis]GIF89887.1 membrane protein [Catellatospora chokoriensis]
MTVTADDKAAARSGTGPAAARIAGAATLIALLTVLSRLAGFARTLVFSQTVGSGGLGGTYLAVNTIPNIIFEIVAGGALAGLVVPLLAGPLAAGDREQVRRTVSALLTWALVALIPLAALLWLAADPVVTLLQSTATPELHEAGVSMLRVFAPQVPLYGIGIVLTGVLHAHRRFAWPVLAPLLSSLTVIGAYLLFAAEAGARPLPGTVSAGELAILSVGTTVGVVVLTLCLVIPVSRLGLGLRPVFGVEPVQRRRMGSLALAGAATVVAQQVALLVAIVLAGRVVPVGDEASANALYNFAMTLYLLPWAVLAVPAATAAYPAIATAFATADHAALRLTVARTGRAVLLLSGLGAAGLAAVAAPASAFLAEGAGTAALTSAVLAFAPGLLGYGLAALHQRTLYAVGANRLAALGVSGGWAVTLVAAVILSWALPDGQRAVALGAANSIGMLVMAALLAVAVRARVGGDALIGLWRATLAASAAALAGGAAGLEAGRAVVSGTPGIMGLAGQGMLSGGVSLVVFLIVCALLDLPDLRPLLERVSRRRG